MAMQHVETKVGNSHIHMRFADYQDPTKATEWLEFQVPFAPLKASDGRQPLGDPQLEYLAEVQRAALRFVRDAVSAELQRLANLANQNF